MKLIGNLLRERIGLNADPPGRALIRHAVAERARALGLKDAEDYPQLLLDSPEEFERLVEAVVVSETWFFRDREPFRALIKLVRREWLPAHPSGTLRILSAPCSTGEEPYSIAMALLDAEFPAARFQIEAVDVRPAAILCAQRAEYGKNSFRSKDLKFRARYFLGTSSGYRLNAGVCEKVRFDVGNILDARLLAEREPFDFIFCRNLLMYLDPAAREQVLQTLNRSLKRGGALFVGAAEVLIAAGCGFVPAKLPFSFSCRKAPSNPQPEAQHPLPGSRPDKIRRQPLPAPAIAALPQPATRAATDRASLGTARRLADQGRFIEAAKICEDHLQECGVSAEAFYLLGLVLDTTGSAHEACEFYRKALYLEPDHYETLTHWARLSEKSGDDARARILAERANRIRKPG